MKCIKAEELIALKLDGVLSAKERRLLEQHISNCPDCLRYNQQMESLAVKLNKDANSIEQQNIPTRCFTDRLHSALLNEQYSRSKEPAILIERHLDRFIFRSRFKLRNAIYVTGAAVILVFMVICSVLSLINVPACSRTERSFGHFAAFNAQTLPDGRVYADLSEQSSTGHLIKNRGDRK